MIKKPFLLVILDGFGLRKSGPGNAITLAKTPNLTDLFTHYPWTSLDASGPAVGLPKNQMGNSEVGHLNIGAGEIFYTGLSLINKAIADNTFFENQAFLQAINHAKQNQSTLHLMGLLSPGGVHSLQEHLFLLLDLAHQHQLHKVTVHVFTDGRDVAPQSVKPWLKLLIAKLDEYKYQLGSISGRLYAMDRDQRFELITQAYQAICGQSPVAFTNPLDYIDKSYQQNLTDEFIVPAMNDSQDVKFLTDNDSIIFVNFRPDRARELTHVLIGSNLYNYQPSQRFKNLFFVSMMKYEGIKTVVAFKSMEIKNTLGSVLAQNHLHQLRISETQKYAHVTFFLDGGIDIKYPLSQRILIDSPKIDNFAFKPEMAAEKITAAILQQLPNFDVVIVNYANCDMVGHTGNLTATISAVEIIDQQIGQLKTAIDQLNGVMFITADHGNAEIMFDENQKPATKHTSSQVPLITTDKNLKFISHGKLANITPTILDYLKLEKPSSMSEKSLIKH